MIEIKGLTKKYDGKAVYENFDFSIEEGRTTCVLGESGSGKTTLLNCIAGLTRYEGEIPKLKCSYVFQTPRLVPNLTVYGNLALIGASGDEIDGVLERVKLVDKRGAYPAELSGGQKQRVSLARALLYGGEIMLLDEPFASLDLKLKREMARLFNEIACERGLTALFVTHDPDEALSVANRVVVISGGKTVADIKADGQSFEKARERIISALVNA